MSQESGVRSQESGVRSQESGVRSQESGVRSQGRIVGLDFVKGIAIFLVVFGHCIQYGNGQEYAGSGAFFDDILFKIIYSFHMPLFALVSGYLFFWSVSSRSPRKVIMRQANNLVLPSLSWAVLINMMRGVLHAYRGNFEGMMPLLLVMLRNFLYSLWFLWAMFLASMVVLLAREKFNDSIKFYVFSIIISLFVPSIIIPSVHVFVYPYFVAGYLWHREEVDINPRLWIKVGVILLWFIMLVFYNRSAYVYTTGTVILRRSTGFMPKQLMIDVFRWVIGFAGCGAVLILLKLFKPVKFIAAIGTRSLGIYITSGYIMKYLPERGGYVVNFVEAVIIISACYVLSVIISRMKLLNKLLLGGR